jgi:hypothetical protein
MLILNNIGEKNMTDKPKIKVKKMTESQDKKWSELFASGQSTDSRSVDDSPIIAQNLQSYENYLTKNMNPKKKRK